MKLTPAQRKKLEFLTEEWREEPEDWISGALFGRLEVMGLCEMKQRRLAGGDVTTGPGSWGVYRWFTRRTPAGTAALASQHNQTEAG